MSMCKASIILMQGQLDVLTLGTSKSCSKPVYFLWGAGIGRTLDIPWISFNLITTIHVQSLGHVHSKSHYHTPGLAEAKMKWSGYVYLVDRGRSPKNIPKERSWGYAEMFSTSGVWGHVLPLKN